MGLKEDKTIADIVQAVKEIDAKKTKGYDTQATVTRVEDGKAWVHIPGGVPETPAELTINAKPGDNVMVRVVGGRAFLLGNATSPPTDDATAKEALSNANDALQSAVNARRAADSAEASAATASAAAQDAVETAEAVHGIAVQAQTDAETAKTNAQTAIENAAAAQSAAGAAQTSADNAASSAASAQNSANGALNGLSTVQDVIGVLDWAKDNATYTLTSDPDIEPGKTYWTRSGSGTEADPYTYTPVVTPVKADLGTYYEISGVDEAMADYINTHLALTDEGLYVLGGANQWKVLIAPDGVYIINDTGNVVAKYKGAVTLGEEGHNNLIVDQNSLNLTDEGFDDYFHVGLPSDPFTEVTPLVYASDGGYTDPTGRVHDNALFLIWGEYLGVDDVIDVYDIVNGVYLTEGVDYWPSTRTGYLKIYLDGTLNNLYRCTYKTDAVPSDQKYFVFGDASDRATGATNIRPGVYSVTVGMYLVNSGLRTFMMGLDCSANGNVEDSLIIGRYNHVYGSINGNTKAVGNFVAGQNNWIAYANWAAALGYRLDIGYDYQLAVGKYNNNFSEDAFEIGNGTSSPSRSNAFSVSWDGETRLSVQQFNTDNTVDKKIYDSLVALGWDDDCIDRRKYVKIDTSYHGSWVESGQTVGGKPLYQSSGSYHVGNAWDTAKITFTGYKDFAIMIRSYAESTYDYVLVSRMNNDYLANCTSTSAMRSVYDNLTYTWGNTRGRQSASDYIRLVHTGLDPDEEYYLYVIFQKDGSGDKDDDRGYFYLDI